MTSTEQQPTPQELFRSLAARMSAMGIPVGDLLRAAEAEQRQGDEGAFVELEPDEHGPGAIIAVKRDTVDVRVGGQGFGLDLDEVRLEYLPDTPDNPPANPSS